jgi:hypothetical protein
MSLDGVIGAAVDKATSSGVGTESPSGNTADRGATNPSAPSSAPTPADGTAAPSGSDGQVFAPGSTDAPTTRATETTTTPELPAPEPPPLKWGQVLENARTKTFQATRNQVFSEYGLADDLDPVEVRAHLDLLRRDPQLHAELTLQALKRDGTYQPRQSETPDERFPEERQPLQLPQPALTSVDGQSAFTAEQVLQVVQVALGNFRRELGGELQPLQAMHQQAQIAQVRADARAYAGDAVAEARNWAHFAQLTPRVREIMVSDGRATLLSAYNRALQEHLKTSQQSIKQQARRDTLEEIQQASKANTIRPGVGVTNSGSKPTRGGLDARLDRALNAALTTVTR